MRIYDTFVEVLLEPVGTPQVAVSCQGRVKEFVLDELAWVEFKFSQTQGLGKLTVEHKNKHPHDPTTAVIIKAIRLNTIESPQALYEGVYTPENRSAVRDTYLSWNGHWTLEFSVPVFTWLHKTQGLGWIYD